MFKKQRVNKAIKIYYDQFLALQKQQEHFRLALEKIYKNSNLIPGDVDILTSHKAETHYFFALMKSISALHEQRTVIGLGELLETVPKSMHADLDEYCDSLLSNIKVDIDYLDVMMLQAFVYYCKLTESFPEEESDLSEYFVVVKKSFDLALEMLADDSENDAKIIKEYDLPTTLYSSFRAAWFLAKSD